MGIAKAPWEGRRYPKTANCCWPPRSLWALQLLQPCKAILSHSQGGWISSCSHGTHVVLRETVTWYSWLTEDNSSREVNWKILNCHCYGWGSEASVWADFSTSTHRWKWNPSSCTFTFLTLEIKNAIVSKGWCICFGSPLSNNRKSELQNPEEINLAESYPAKHQMVASKETRLWPSPSTGGREHKDILSPVSYNRSVTSCQISGPSWF